MLKRLVCLAFLSLFATSVAYAQEDENKPAEEPPKAADFAALGQLLEALTKGAESQNKTLDDVDNNNTKTVTDNAPQTASEAGLASAAAVSMSDVAASESATTEKPVTEANPE